MNRLLFVPGLAVWSVTFAIAAQQFIADTLWLLRRRRRRQPGLNTAADADAFVDELHAAAAETGPPVTPTPLQHNESTWWMPQARTTPLVAELTRETRNIQMTMTRTETVWDMGTPIYDSVVADLQQRRALAERRRRALEDPTSEFRQIVSASLFDQASVLIGRPPTGDRRSGQPAAASAVEDRQPEVVR